MICPTCRKPMLSEWPHRHGDAYLSGDWRRRLDSDPLVVEPEPVRRQWAEPAPASGLAILALVGAALVVIALVGFVAWVRP